MLVSFGTYILATLLTMLPILSTPALVLWLLLGSTESVPPTRNVPTNITAIAKTLRWQPIVSDITAPVGMTVTPAYPDKAFILCQPGQFIMADLKTGKTQQLAMLNAEVLSPNAGYDERGLLGIAFHPEFKANRKLFLHYSRAKKATGQDHESVVAEFTLNQKLELSSGKDILVVPQPESNHNGGDLAFGPDGYLYIGLGDGGGQGDKHGTEGNAQNMQSLLGKILRINVDKAESGKSYAIPADNPFALDKGTRPEIWASGFRNPWRFSFDKKTGQLYTGDVGQDKYEEVNLVEKGKNYGWRLMEGLHCYNPATNCATGKVLEKPIDEYPHSVGVSVTGGYVYRGTSIPALQGTYIFGDWLNHLFLLTPPEKAGAAWQRTELGGLAKPAMDQLRVNAFGQDEQGEVYLCAQNGTGPHATSGAIFKLVPASN